MSNPDGKYRLLNPLNIRFSQPRVAPLFRDGRHLAESQREVQVEMFEVPTDIVGVETPPYDCVLVPPFPIIRVISWLPKVRHPDGEAETDRYGDQVYGERAWFALDNRRLHVLQSFATQMWPKRCSIIVRCLEEVPGTTVRELRKFRTTTEGRSVEVGARGGSSGRWRWQDALPRGASCENVANEGVFSEELFDAMIWTPAAMNRCIEREAVRQRRRAREGTIESVSTMEPNADSGGSDGGDAKPTARRRAELPSAPEDGWQYIDHSGKVQGPFCREKMRLWNERHYFFPQLPMRCAEEDDFAPFAELFPKPMEPFKSCVMRRRAVQ